MRDRVGLPNNMADLPAPETIFPSLHGMRSACAMLHHASFSDDAGTSSFSQSVHYFRPGDCVSGSLLARARES
jgi:hypothetical protein